ncbi:hypothetical protein Dimus_027651 [Dionaea muscipula]
MMMSLKERKGIDPALLKFGVALALSFAGFLYSRMRAKRIKPPLAPLPPSDYNNQLNSGEDRAGNMDDSHSTQRMPSCQAVSSTSTDTYEPPRIRLSVENYSSMSLSGRYIEDKDGFLLPEFTDLVKDFDKSAPVTVTSLGKEVETPESSGAGTPRASKSVDRSEYEQEIWSLKNMVGLLRERERHLEVQLLEYYGLKEQEKAVMELQNRLKINNMEARLFSLKIESLLADNKRLEAQVADYAKVVAELEAAKGKIKLLRKKLKYEAEQNKEQILSLKQRVTKLQDYDLDRDVDIHSKLQRLKELEVESEELRKSNINLQLENSELEQRLESTQMLATSILEDPDVTAELRKEAMYLKQENESLAKENERLKSDRCADVEELVYLRWINACLRYELRNYQAPPGKTIARDLSKSLSPRSEKKAKQLILEYANTQGGGSAVDFDSDQWSSSQSNLTDSPDDSACSDLSSISKPPHTSSKAKFFSKLRRLILGRDGGHHHHHHQRQASTLTKAHSMEYYGQVDAKSLKNGSSGRSSIELGGLPSLSEVEEDTKDMEGVRNSSDSGSSYIYKRFVLGRSMSSSQGDQQDKDSGSSQQSELLKYAEAFRNSTWAGTGMTHQKAASYGP